MKTSNEIDQIAAALLTAQQTITFATKDASNPHFRSRYADLPAVIEAVKPALNAAGIAFLQCPSPSEDGRLHLTTRLLHASGQWMEDTAVCPLPKADAQGFGSTCTYLRRYALAAMCGLYQDDDDGNGASLPPPTVKRTTPAAPPSNGHTPGQTPKQSAPTNTRTAEPLRMVPQPQAQAQAQAHPQHKDDDAIDITPRNPTPQTKQTRAAEIERHISDAMATAATRHPLDDAFESLPQARINAFLTARDMIAHGQTYHDLSPDNVRRVLKHLDSFIKAGNLRGPVAANA